MNDMNKALDRRSGFRLERWLKVRAPAPSRPLEFKRQEDLEAWIAAWIGDKLRLDPDTLDRAAGVTDFGLDSLAAIELSAALEGVLGHAVSPGAA
jgi:acyl carrier protein